MQTRHILVVGGGLAGLAVSTQMARTGRAVTLLERASRPGGRAASRVVDGFVLNQGAHALYRGGLAERALAELGVPLRGGRPPASGAALVDGDLRMLPAGPFGTIATRTLGWAGKWQLGRLLAEIRRADVGSLSHVSVADWLGRTVTRADARALAEAIVRVTTYGGEPELMSAAVAVTQLRGALASGVVYLDGGWQTLVDGLESAARRAGVRLRYGTRVGELIREGSRVRGLRLEDGTRLEADAVVLAVGPAAASTLTGVDLAGAVRPVRAATLDLALARVPVPKNRFVLGLDRPLYLSVHSATARLAPEGAGMVHAMKYLGTGPSDPERDRADVEALLDLAQPGWREHVRHAQWLPAAVVHNDLPCADRGGFEGRTTIDVPGLRGAFLAGDWIGSEGLLSDAVLASARAVAARIAPDAICSDAA